MLRRLKGLLIIADTLLPLALAGLLAQNAWLLVRSVEDAWNRRCPDAAAPAECRLGLRQSLEHVLAPARSKAATVADAHPAPLDRPLAPLEGAHDAVRQVRSDVDALVGGLPLLSFAVPSVSLDPAHPILDKRFFGQPIFVPGLRTDVQSLPLGEALQAPFATLAGSFANALDAVLAHVEHTRLAKQEVEALKEPVGLVPRMRQDLAQLAGAGLAIGEAFAVAGERLRLGGALLLLWITGHYVLWSIPRMKRGVALMMRANS